MNRRARIIHVYKDVWPPVEGGIERIIHLLARLVPSDEFETGIIVASRDRAGRRRVLSGTAGSQSAIEVVEVPSFGRALSTPLAPAFVGALRDSRADLFHFHVPHPTGEVAWLLSGGRVPAVATYHSDVVRQRAAMLAYAPVFQHFLHRLRAIMPTSRRYLETSEPLRAHRDRCRVVPLGYPLQNYILTPAIAARADALRRGHGEFILFLGCLRAYKGLNFLLDALAQVPGARAVIAGDGAQALALREQAHHLALGDRVIFTGRVDDEEAVALLHAAALFVLPAHQRSEAFGLCQVEAMACGLPIISTDLPTGVPEVNVHGETGLIVAPGNADALAGAIRELLADPARRSAMGEAGRERAALHYTAERMAHDVAEVYRAALRS